MTRRPRAGDVAYRVGIDENGLGALLGPLVVTAVTARVEPTERPRGPSADASLLGDSKALVAHGDVALGEAWARVLGPPAVASPAALLDALLDPPRASLMARCPPGASAQCWSADDERFLAGEALVSRVRAAAATLAAEGLELVGARSALLCTDFLNAELSEGRHRFLADLHAMESLMLRERRARGVDLEVIAGKVGGMQAYGRFFGPLSAHLHSTREESRARSSYDVAGVGVVHFVRDADATEPLVMIASLVGKYLRELVMARVARFHGEAAGVSARPSGYHDPVTLRFVSATEEARAHFPERCFRRVGRQSP